MKAGASGKKPTSAGGATGKQGGRQKVKTIGGDNMGNPAEVYFYLLILYIRLKSYLMMVKNTFLGKVTTNKIWKLPFITLTKLASKILVINFWLKLLDFAAAHHYRGRCFQGMGDFQRALYDFSLAISLDNNQQAKP